MNLEQFETETTPEEHRPTSLNSAPTSQKKIKKKNLYTVFPEFLRNQTNPDNETKIEGKKQRDGSKKRI